VIDLVLIFYLFNFLFIIFSILNIGKECKMMLCITDYNTKKDMEF